MDKNELIWLEDPEGSVFIQKGNIHVCLIYWKKSGSWGGGLSMYSIIRSSVLLWLSKRQTPADTLVYIAPYPVQNKFFLSLSAFWLAEIGHVAAGRIVGN